MSNNLQISIKYPVAKIMAILKKNRAAHAIEHSHALGIYRGQLVTYLRKKLERAEAGEDINHTISLNRPQEYLDSYDTAIRMLGLTTQKELELSNHDFNRLVMDDWEWKAQYNASNSSYLTVT